jgi:radical SAM superfamily enzyme YgiQ (UPF0313 family)
MYQSKRFRPRPFVDLLEEIKIASQAAPATRRIFLADGDAFVLSPSKLTRILKALRKHFPALERVSTYADAKSITRKSPQELEELQELGLSLLYMGLESGSDRVLHILNKEASAGEMATAIQAANRAGFSTSVILLLGAGGIAHSEEHIQESARIASEMSPHFLSALTLTLVPGTPLESAATRGEFLPVSPERSLEELRLLVDAFSPCRATIFRSNHASSYLPLAGTLPRDRATLLANIDQCLHQGSLRPEWQRGL